MTANLYGIPTCDSVRKARKWLTDNDIDHQFIDVRENTPPKSQIGHWVTSLGAAKMVNKRSTTWKQLEKSVQSIVDTGPSNQEIIDLFIAQPTLIKRPVLVNDNNEITVGFSEQDYLAHCK